MTQQLAFNRPGFDPQFNNAGVYEVKAISAAGALACRSVTGWHVEATKVDLENRGYQVTTIQLIRKVA